MIYEYAAGSREVDSEGEGSQERCSLVLPADGTRENQESNHGEGLWEVDGP